MKATDFLLGLAPWVLFSIVAERLGADSVGYGTALACAVSLVLAARSIKQGGPTVIETAGVITFGVLTVVSFLYRARESAGPTGRRGPSRRRRRVSSNAPALRHEA